MDSTTDIGSSAAPRLVMASSSCAGCGKSVLVRALRDRLDDLGRRVVVVDEDAVWGARRFDDEPVDYASAWPEFRALLHERPSASAVSVVEVIDTFLAVGRRIGPESWWLQDWLWVDLLGLAAVEGGEIVASARRLRELAARRRPLVMWLEVDAEVALGRAARERGQVWLARHAREFGGGVGVEAGLGELAAARVEAGRRRRRILEESGWELVDIDATGEESSVLEAALEVLRLE